MNYELDSPDYKRGHECSQECVRHNRSKVLEETFLKQSHIIHSSTVRFLSDVGVKTTSYLTFQRSDMEFVCQFIHYALVGVIIIIIIALNQYTS